MSTPPEDTRRLADSAAELDAAAELGAISPVEAMRAAVAHTRDRLADARARFADAIGAADASDAVHARREASAFARKTWRYVRGVIEHHLLNPPPEIEIDADEHARREALLRRLSPLQPSELMGPDRLVKQLGALREAIDSPTAADDLEGLDFDKLRESLDGAVEQLGAAIADADARDLPSAGTARRELDEARALHAMMVEVALREAGRPDALGDFIQRPAASEETRGPRKRRRTGTRVVSMGRR